jgi:hypothetical protein
VYNLSRFRGQEGNLGLQRSVIMSMRNVLTIVYFVLTIYSFSGGLLHGIANYSSWKLISAEDFPAVHQYVNRRILAVYVPFFFLSVAVNILLIWFHPPAISTMLVVIAAVLNLFICVITATLAIPIHKQLDQFKSTELIGRLVKVHLYLRLIPGSLNMIATALMMYRVLGAAS